MSRRLSRVIPGIWRGATAALGLAVGLGACAGEVGTPSVSPTGSPTGSPAGSAGTGAGTTGAAGSGGGATGTAGTGGPAGPLDVGITTAIRLNRTQYNNTVRDLLGTTLTPADAFPADETSLGFDTIGGTLKIQPERSEKYLSASADLINELFARPATDAISKRHLVCDYAAAGATGATCQKQILTGFATKAWRRPVTDAELAAYLTLAAAGPTPKDGLIAAMRAVLVSSNFIFRFERDPNPDDAKAHRLASYELASRLSYFLWGTMPDDALFTAAGATGATGLLDDAGLKAQVTRMLADASRTQVLIDTFASQWLGVGKLQSITPDKTEFPTFNENVRAAMIQEVKKFIMDFVGNGKPIPQMLRADFTYANATLATFYGLPAVQGDAFQKIPTTGTKRAAGLLTLGSYLAGESNPNRTSPVKRGLYVMDRLLCAAPPPPPANVSLNIDQGSGLENLPIRQRLAQHQMKGSGCAACHVIMDAIGLGLENFDAVGRYRTMDEFGAIDATGKLPVAGGTMAFDGADQLSTILANDSRFVPCVVSKMLSYSVGRSFENDRPMSQQLAQGAGGNAASLRAALESVIMSDAFRSRRAALQTEVMP